MAERYPTIQSIQEARQRIETLVHRTPVMSSNSVNRLAGAKIYFKCENFQRGGSYKIRGAANAVLTLPAAKAKNGVAAHSTGNHAAALAIAAAARGIPVHIVMPEDSAEVKREAVRDSGAKIRYCGSSLADRKRAAAELAAETGAYLVHPAYDPVVLSGHGGLMLEFLEDVPDLDVVMVPVGAGGLISACGVGLKNLHPNSKLIGVEPKGADDVFRSLSSGRLIPCEEPKTICDALRTELGELTFDMIKRYVDDVVTVTDKAVVYAMRCVWERLKIIVEPSAVVALASILERDIDVAGKSVGIILTGGNVDLDSIPWSTTRDFKPGDGPTPTTDPAGKAPARTTDKEES